MGEFLSIEAHAFCAVLLKHGIEFSRQSSLSGVDILCVDVFP